MIAEAHCDIVSRLGATGVPRPRPGPRAILAALRELQHEDRKLAETSKAVAPSAQPQPDSRSSWPWCRLRVLRAFVLNVRLPGYLPTDRYIRRSRSAPVEEVAVVAVAALGESADEVISRLQVG